MMKIPRPFLPVRAETKELCHTVRVLGREYTFGADGLLESVKSEGVELLSSPMRIVCREDGAPAIWDDDYENNESESFILHRSDEKIILCGAKQSERFIVDTCTTVDYDGCMDIDLKLMTRGKTVPQLFGTAADKPVLYVLDSLWLEIPLNTKACTLFHMFPNSEIRCGEKILPMSKTSMSGALPDETIELPFKSLLWLGNDFRGLGFYAENDRNWQPAEASSAIEIIRDGETTLIRLRLLDSNPVSWTDDPEDGSRKYMPISFRFGIQTTPVKPMPKQPYIHHALHLDCGIKIKGNYMDFMSQENRFDRLTQMGVDTLILHEKWNKCQNYFELSEYTKKQLAYICDECHKRGIRVLTYFGYEISTLAPIWSDKKSEVRSYESGLKMLNGWWRVPFQRDYMVCYNTEYADKLVEGVTDVMDTFHTDGVYLDGTAYLRYCCDPAHGCGWYDASGNLHGSYPVQAVRKLFKKLYDAVSSRGGEINSHSSECVNFTALPYISQCWCGENQQMRLMHGSTDDMALDYFRAEYSGRNMGVPVEFIAYENRPYWTFENAVAYSILHGILPRPNDIGHPLELMSKIWKILNAFPIEQAEWLPFWCNDASSTSDKVRISYYRYTDLAGRVQLLAFLVNISAKTCDTVTIGFSEKVTTATDMERGEQTGLTFSMEKYSYKILFLI